MSKKEFVMTVLAMLVILACKAGLTMLAQREELREFRRQAVTRGHATYDVNADEEPVFRWKDTK